MTITREAESAAANQPHVLLRQPVLFYQLLTRAVALSNSIHSVLTTETLRATTETQQLKGPASQKQSIHITFTGTAENTKNSTPSNRTNSLNEGGVGVYVFGGGSLAAQTLLKPSQRLVHINMTAYKVSKASGCSDTWPHNAHGGRLTATEHLWSALI